jgi:hypothetical protein
MEDVMKVRWVIGRALVLGLMLGMAALQYAQDSSPTPDKARRSVAINLLRGINTAEAIYNHKHGGYAPWEILRTSDEFTDSGLKWAAKMEPQLADAKLGPGPEILLGWNLRLNVTADGKGYDLLLEDTTDKACHYAAGSDERGVIRQSKTIDCTI